MSRSTWLRRAVVPAAVLVGAVSGVWTVRGGADAFMTPSPPDSRVWELVVPGRQLTLNAALTTPSLGRGTQLRGGMLWLGEHAFGRSEIMRPLDERPVSEVWIDVGAGVVQLNFAGLGEQRAMAYLTADTVKVSTKDRPRPRPPEPLRFTVQEGSVTAHLEDGPVQVGPASEGTIELQSAGAGGVLSVRLLDAAGEVYVDQDFAALSAGFSDVEGATLGALVGLMLGLSLAWTPGVSGAALSLLLLAGPLWVVREPFTGWVQRVETLYLTRTPVWELAPLALWASLVPLALLAAVRAPWMTVSRASRLRSTPQLAAWGATVGGVGVLVSRDDWALLVPGVLFLALPLILALRARLPLLPWLARDAPALAAVAVGGWALAPLATAWRFVPVVASRSLLLTQARPTADHLFVLALCLPLSLEVALRQTYLAEAWRPEALTAQEQGTEQGLLDDNYAPHWKGRCGPEHAADERSLIVAGGSATGGAYQFRTQPEAFFPARLHAKLCARLPEGTALTTWNYGAGGRDTHVISQALTGILERSQADMVVLYVGVNDLLTTHSAQTRKQREAMLDGAVTQSLAGVAGRSLVVTGLGLWRREAGTGVGEAVAEVPLADARENLTSIAVQAEGLPVLLVSQVVVGASQADLASYWTMEAELAAEHEGVDFLDVSPAFDGLPTAEILLDRNHLSRSGHERLADTLLPGVAEGLGIRLE